MDAIKLAKALLGIADNDVTQDTKLTALKTIVEAQVKAYCNVKSISKDLTPIIAKMIMIDFNRMGKEHITSHQYSNVTETFRDSYSSDIFDALNMYVNKKKANIWGY